MAIGVKTDRSLAQHFLSGKGKEYESKLTLDIMRGKPFSEIFNPKDNVNHEGYDYTPLMAAVHCKNYDCLNGLLKQAKIDPNLGNQGHFNFGSPLLLATIASDNIAMEKLLEHPLTNPNLTSRCIPEPPLFLAIGHVNKTGVELLLKNPKIDLSVKLEGKTPYEYAVSKGKTEIAELIKVAMNKQAETKATNKPQRGWRIFGG